MTDAAHTVPPLGAAPTPGEPLLVRRDGALARVTLNRPEQRNTLTPAMTQAFSAAITRWGSDPNIYALVLDATGPGPFCAGTDLAGVADLDIPAVLATRADEARLIWRIECCVKPMASLIDGAVTGTGAGLSMYGTHRVAGAGYTLSMPETGLGSVPGSGATHFLGRLPGSIGVYLALTGAGIDRGDAFALGLVTHCIDGGHFAAIREGLAQADPIDPLLDDLHRAPAEGTLAPVRAAITRCFRHETLEAVLAALAEETGATQAWARQTLEALGRRCPFSLKVALRQLRAGTGDSPPNQALAVALEREYAVAEHIVARSDFRAGLHAALAGDTDPPAWWPSALSGVTPALIDAAFAPHDAPRLGLPPRQQSLVALG